MKKSEKEGIPVERVNGKNPQRKREKNGQSKRKQDDIFIGDHFRNNFIFTKCIHFVAHNLFFYRQYSSICAAGFSRFFKLNIRNTCNTDLV